MLVRDPVEPLRVLLTDTAVLYGTPEAPCVEYLDAELVKTVATPGGTRERALLGAQGISWLFRIAPDAARREVRVEYRAMTCRPDPNAEIPPEVYDLPDTHDDG